APTGAWVNLPDMPQTMDDMGGATVGPAFFTVAGRVGAGTTSNVYRYYEFTCPPTSTPTITKTRTITSTPTPTGTFTITPTRTPTGMFTPTFTPTITPTPTNTPMGGCSISYPNFSSISGLMLVGNAGQAGSILQLTTAANSQIGSAWYNNT